jgi:hypothetical protein
MLKSTLLIVIFVLISFVDFGQGCSQCRLLAEQGSENVMDEQSFGSNINFGILYLLIIPYLLILFLFRKRIVQFFKQRLQKKN